MDSGSSNYDSDPVWETDNRPVSARDEEDEAAGSADNELVSGPDDETSDAQNQLPLVANDELVSPDNAEPLDDEEAADEEDDRRQISDTHMTWLYNQGYIERGRLRQFRVDGGDDDSIHKLSDFRLSRHATAWSQHTRGGLSYSTPNTPLRQIQDAPQPDLDSDDNLDSLRGFDGRAERSDDEDDFGDAEQSGPPANEPNRSLSIVTEAPPTLGSISWGRLGGLTGGKWDDGDADEVFVRRLSDAISPMSASHPASGASDSRPDARAGFFDSNDDDENKDEDKDEDVGFFRRLTEAASPSSATQPASGVIDSRPFSGAGFFHDDEEEDQTSDEDAGFFRQLSAESSPVGATFPAGGFEPTASGTNLTTEQEGSNEINVSPVTSVSPSGNSEETNVPGNEDISTISGDPGNESPSQDMGALAPVEDDQSKQQRSDSLADLEGVLGMSIGHVEESAEEFIRRGDLRETPAEAAEFLVRQRAELHRREGSLPGLTPLTVEQRLQFTQTMAIKYRNERELARDERDRFATDFATLKEDAEEEMARLDAEVRRLEEDVDRLEDELDTAKRLADDNYEDYDVEVEDALRAKKAAEAEQERLTKELEEAKEALRKCHSHGKKLEAEKEGNEAIVKQLREELEKPKDADQESDRADEASGPEVSDVSLRKGGADVDELQQTKKTLEMRVPLMQGEITKLGNFQRKLVQARPYTPLPTIPEDRSVGFQVHTVQLPETESEEARTAICGLESQPASLTSKLAGMGLHSGEVDSRETNADQLALADCRQCIEMQAEKLAALEIKSALGKLEVEQLVEQKHALEQDLRDAYLTIDEALQASEADGQTADAADAVIKTKTATINTLTAINTALEAKVEKPTRTVAALHDSEKDAETSYDAQLERKQHADELAALEKKYKQESEGHRSLLTTCAASLKGVLPSAIFPPPRRIDSGDQAERWWNAVRASDNIKMPLKPSKPKAWRAREQCIRETQAYRERIQAHAAWGKNYAAHDESQLALRQEYLKKVLGTEVLEYIPAKERREKMEAVVKK